MNYDRSEDRARMLLFEAEKLIAARAKKLGVSPRSVVNQIMDNDDAPDIEKAGKDEAVAELLARLGRGDGGLRD